MKKELAFNIIGLIFFFGLAINRFVFFHTWSWLQLIYIFFIRFLYIMPSYPAPYIVFVIFNAPYLLLIQSIISICSYFGDMHTLMRGSVDRWIFGLIGIVFVPWLCIIINLVFSLKKSIS